jgi:hypothetical protein
MDVPENTHRHRMEGLYTHITGQGQLAAAAWAVREPDMGQPRNG